MPKVPPTFFDDEDSPELRFEDAAPEAPAPPKRRAANYAAAPHMPAYGVTADSYSELSHKEESVFKLQQELEKTRREAEELRIRQNKEDRFAGGRRELCEKISRNLAKLDRELGNAEKAIEEIGLGRKALQENLATLRSIEVSPNEPLSDDELDDAIGILEGAEADFGKTSRRLGTVLPRLLPEVSNSLDGPAFASFRFWLRAGCAFALPPLGVGIIITLLVKFLPNPRHEKQQ